MSLALLLLLFLTCECSLYSCFSARDCSNSVRKVAGAVAEKKKKEEGPKQMYVALPSALAALVATDAPLLREQ